MFKTNCMQYFLRKIPPCVVITLEQSIIRDTLVKTKVLHFRTCIQLLGLPGPGCPQFQAHQLTLVDYGHHITTGTPNFFSLSGIPNIQKYCKEIVKRQSLNIPACQKVCLFLRGQKLAQAVELAILEDRMYNTIIIRLGASQRGCYQAIKKRRDLLGLSTDFLILRSPWLIILKSIPAFVLIVQKLLNSTKQRERP